MINIVLIDDHVIVRSGFAQLLNLEEGMRVIAEFGSARETRQKMPGLNVHICIMDISMPDENGLELLKDIPSSIYCIMLSVNDSDFTVRKAFELGAKGYLSKRCSPEELIQAVRTVYTGGCYLPPELAVKLASPKSYAPSMQLTKRELEVCELLVSGLETKEIAERLGLSFKTVHVHRANAMGKLNVKNNVELVNYFHASFQ